jgi:hypothetical protein
MQQFKDGRTEEIYHARACAGVIPHVAHEAWWIMRQLTHAHDIKDVGCIRGQIYRWSSSPNRLGLRVDAKWFVTFGWDDALGASEILVERKKATRRCE